MLPYLIKILRLGCVAWLGLSSTCLGSRRIQVQSSEPSQRNQACQHAPRILGLGVQSQKDWGGLLVSGPGSLANSRSASDCLKKRWTEPEEQHLRLSSGLCLHTNPHVYKHVGTCKHTHIHSHTCMVNL